MQYMFGTKVCQNFIANFTKQYSWLINFDYGIMVTAPIIINGLRLVLTRLPEWKIIKDKMFLKVANSG